MKFTRREYIKANAAVAAAAAAQISLPAQATPYVATEDTQLKWSKAPCRFCGTGCGVMVAVKENRVVATHGDIKAEVNRGLNCVKGYFLSKIMYGSDRLNTPMLRMRDGEYHKEGEFEPVSWDRAFDEMARQWKRVIKEKGPNAVGMLGSGQWTIWEGYAATKLMRAGFRTNNLDPNARHCMASAAVAFIRTFGMDEPMGCYDDIEAADAFVLWGSNMAEMHPILWTRVSDRRISAPHVKVAVLSTFEHRSFELADIPMVFEPGTDLAILNYIANHIIQTGKVNREFVDKHCNFRMGQTDIGYGLRPEHVLEVRATGAKEATASTASNFEDFAKLVSTYTLDYTAELTGADKGRLQALAELYADPKTKVMSFWTMGFNQHVRGVWANHMIYNIHLLTGKIAEPGNSPFSLTGQPSACGTAREVGTFSHRLPADMQVTNPEHRKKTEEIWKLPAGLLPDKVGYHAVQQDRMLKDGKLNAYWIQVNNNLQAAPNSDNETYVGYRNPDNFIVVSDAYPTVTAMAADLVLPAAMWVERRAPTATPSAAPTSGTSLSQRRERPDRTFGSSWSFQSGSRPTRSGRLKFWTRIRHTGARRCTRYYTRTARWTSSRYRTWTRNTRTSNPSISGSTSRKGCSRNTPPSGATTVTTLPILTNTTRYAACAGRWWTTRRRSGVTGKAWTPTSRKARASTSTAIRTAGLLSSASLTNRPPRPPTRNTTCGW